MYKFLCRSKGEQSKSRSFLPVEKQFLVTKNGKTSTYNYRLILSVLVPAIPPEMLSKLQESSEISDSPDHFQNIDVELSQIIEEIKTNGAETTVSVTNEPENFDDIPDIEDFENENLLITNDPVNLLIISFFILLFAYFLGRARKYFSYQKFCQHTDLRSFYYL